MTLILSSATDSVQLVTSTGAALDYVSQYVEADTSAVPNEVDDSNTFVGRINTATTTPISGPSPANTTKRWAFTFKVVNVDPSESVQVTVEFIKAGGTPRQVFSALLHAGWALQLLETGEFKIFDQDGVPIGIHVIVDSLPSLPAGTNAIGTVGVTALPGPVGTAGQHTMAASSPVVIASDQSPVATLDTNSAVIKSDLDAIKTDVDHLPAIDTSTAHLPVMDTALAAIKTDVDHLPAMDTALAAIKTDADHLPTIDTTLAEIATDTDNLAAIKTGTDNLAAIKVDVDHLPSIHTDLDTIVSQTAPIAAIKTNSDQLPTIKTNLDTIVTQTSPLAAIKTDLDAIATSTANLGAIKTDLDTIATATANLAGIKTDVDHLPAMDTALAAVKVDVDHLPAMDTALAAIKTDVDHLPAIDTATARIPAQGQAVMAASTPVVVASDQSPIPTRVQPAQGALTDQSSTITTANVSQQILGSNANRKYFLFVNPSDTDMWIRHSAAAQEDQPSILVKADGGSFVMEAGFVSTEAWHVICSSVGKAFVCKEA